MADAYDVIIVGTDAGGRDLALLGKSILLLERGGWLPREKENWSAEDVFVDRQYVSKEMWLDKAGAPIQPGVHYFVGGATKMYGAALYRQRERDFGEFRHQDGLSPAWPMSYAEIEPYYTRAESLYQVHDARGEDLNERPYPRPAVSHEPRIQQLRDDLVRAGYHPVSRAVRHPVGRRRPAVQRMRPLSRLRWLFLPSSRQGRRRGDRGSTGVAVSQCDALDECAGHPAQDEPDRNRGHRGGRRSRRRHRNLPGGIVVVSCLAANSARLLLASANDKHPGGFANLNVPALNIVAASLFSRRVDTAVLALNALLGLGTTLALVLVAVFVGLDSWWRLALAVGLLLAALIAWIVFLPLARGRASQEALVGLSRRFCLFASFVLLYGVVETINGNGAILYMKGVLRADPRFAALALALFWAPATAGRLLFAGVEPWLPSRHTFRLLPCVVGVATALVASSAVGHGVAAFGAAPLHDRLGVGLRTLFGGAAAIALGLSARSVLIIRDEPVAVPCAGSRAAATKSRRR